LATQVFADEELERLRGFPEIGRDELFASSPCLRPMSHSLIPAEAEAEARLTGSAWPWPCARCRGWGLCRTRCRRRPRWR